MSEIVFLVEEAAEGGFSARALGESIFTHADTFEDLREQVADAVCTGTCAPRAIWIS